MAEDKKQKDKEHKRQHEVYKSGDRYHCGECGAELDMGKDCPICKKAFNWDDIIRQVRY